MLAVVRSNPRFRRLWLAQVVSQAGDWFNRVAVLSLLAGLSGPEAALGVGLSFAVEAAMRLFPTAFLSPIAGPLADRLPRRALMVACDLTRVGVVLSLLTVDEAHEVGRLYLLIALQMGLGICFDAARQAALPSTVEREELHDAIALSAATWSAMLSLGALAGGVAVAAFGVQAALAIDAATYLVSALCLAGLGKLPQARIPEPFRWRELLTLADMRRALGHVTEIGIAPALFTKTYWGPAGAFLVLLSIASATRFGLGPDGAPDAERMGGALGVLLAARGVGTAVGPYLGRRLFGSHGPDLLRQIAVGFAIALVGYAAFGLAQSLATAAACVAFAHVGGGSIWVASTSYWQQAVDDRFRGRVHALDFFGMTLSFASFGLVGGMLFDATGRLEVTVWAGCALLAMSSIAWAVATRGLRRAGSAASD